MYVPLVEFTPGSQVFDKLTKQTNNITDATNVIRGNRPKLLVQFRRLEFTRPTAITAYLDDDVYLISLK